MVTRKRYESLENPSGVGEVYEGDEKIAKVSYHLDVQQEILIAETLKETSEVEGLKSMTGSISVLEGSKDLWGKDKLVLHMEDGRKVDFFVKSANLPSTDYEIQPSGSFY